MKQSAQGGAPDPQKMLTVEQAAILLECSASTVWRLRKEGKLNTVHVWGRTAFDVEEVKALAIQRARR